MTSVIREPDGRVTLSFPHTPEALALAIRLLTDQATALERDGPTALAPVRQLRVVGPGEEPERAP